MDPEFAAKRLKLRKNLEILQGLISKFKSTVEGLFIHGNCSFWSVYGGLEKAQISLWEILCFGLKRNKSELILRKELADLLQFSVQPEDHNPDISLQDWINKHLLNYSMSVAITKELIERQNHRAILNLYEDYAAVRNVEILGQIALILQAVERNNLALLGKVNSWLLNKTMFLEKILPYFDDKVQIRSTVNYPSLSDVQDKSQVGSALNSTFYTSGLKEEEMSGDAVANDNELDYTQGTNASEDSYFIENDKRVSPSQKARNVLIRSALAAVKETSEDEINWYDDAHKLGLSAEPMDLARSRLVHLKEISRSETSLFQEKSAQELTGESKSQATATETHSTVSKETSSDAEEIHSDLECRTKSIKRPSSFKRGHSRSKSDQMNIPKAATEEDPSNGSASTILSTSLPSDTLPRSEDSKAYYYHPEDGYMFPKPYEGQSLISYLNSRSYDTGAELDKENAHFSICEALITAIEQMKCSTILDSEEESSDEEIETLRQRIQERKLKKRLEKLDKKAATSGNSRSDTGKSSSSLLTTTSSRSSSHGSSFPEEEVTSDKLSRSWENLTLSTTKQNALKEKAEMSESAENLANVKPDDCSAEAIAKSLLKKFSTHKLPAASELKWVISEGDVPQSLLPFPTSWPVSPDDANQNNGSFEQEDAQQSSIRGSAPRFRGSLEWAPPRAQIVFVLHPVVKRKVILQKQSYRCAGCGLKVSPSLSKRFRYCEYFGKFFCTSCHRNQTSVIPARILLKWDFKTCPVSDFALNLLKKIHADPLFDVDATNPNLFKSIKVMGLVKELGFKVHYIRNFLQTCRHTGGLCRELNEIPSHLYDIEQRFSLDDLVQIKHGELPALLKSLVTSSVRHIRDCQLCKEKGFVCEFCRNGSDVLYPFETNRVFLCSDCKACYHRSCFVHGKCPRCFRLKAREKLRKSISPEPGLSS